jgi:hypothetical protein
MRPPTAVALAATIAVLTLATACSSSSKSDAAATSSASSSQPASSSSTATATDLRGKRYCEVLLITTDASGSSSAEVFNSYPLNDCPEDQWKALDAKAIATENNVQLAILNGPRFWLMDGIEKTDRGDRTHKTFGDIEMIREANVNIGSLASAAMPYTPHEVSRETVFTFDAGSTVYELTAPDGGVDVMQTWSQQKDPNLDEADLPGLATRLQLPAGWTYSSRQLDEPLQVVTTTTPAHVLMDDLGNSYSLETG